MVLCCGKQGLIILVESTTSSSEGSSGKGGGVIWNECGGDTECGKKREGGGSHAAEMADKEAEKTKRDEMIQDSG